MSQYPYNPDIGQTDLMEQPTTAMRTKIARLLSMPCDIDAQDKHGTTALMYAAMKGHRDAVRRLIEHKADLEISEFLLYHEKKPSA